MTKGDHIEYRDAFDRWHGGIALSGIEPTHIDGQKVHDFPVIWVTGDGVDRMPWPATDVRLAPPSARHDIRWPNP